MNLPDNRVWPPSGRWSRPPHRPWNDASGEHSHRDRWRHGRHPWERRRGLLFLRFVATFGVIVVLILGSLAVLAFLLSRLFGGDGRTAALVWVEACGLILVLPLLALALAVRAFRGIATPLSEVMAAADAVADGDLNVRVPVHGPGEFGRLATSFNRMTEELARADRRRRNATADVAHELRTPLHIIQGNLEGVLDGVYEPTPEHIGATLEETKALARLVEDLRTLSLAEAGALPMIWEPVDIGELLADVGTSFSSQAEVSGVELRVEAPQAETGVASREEINSTALKIIADPGRLDQVFGNLIVNALRHTRRGGVVTLRAEPLAGSDAETGRGVRVRVSDTGEGIAAEDLPYVFDRFWRSDRSRSHNEGAGSGLGLAIVRQLVQAHSGRVSVDSTFGEGTVFTVELPADGSQGTFIAS